MDKNNALVTVQMTVDEYLKLNEPKVLQPPKRYVYGLAGLQELIKCSTTTAWRIKCQPWMKPAISQVGRKIIIDADLAIQLIKDNM